jgi:hypothetical protein
MGVSFFLTGGVRFAATSAARFRVPTQPSRSRAVRPTDSPRSNGWALSVLDLLCSNGEVCKRKSGGVSPANGTAQRAKTPVREGTPVTGRDGKQYPATGTVVSDGDVSAPHKVLRRFLEAIKARLRRTGRAAYNKLQFGSEPCAGCDRIYEMAEAGQSAASGAGQGGATSSAARSIWPMIG